MGMAMSHWYETYKMLYTPAERAAEVEALKEAARSLNSSQSRGDASYTRDLAELRDKMQALARLKEEEGGTSGRYERSRGVADFSGL